MEFPKDLKFSKDHEWVRVEGRTATVGITDYAQHALGDVVFAELPTVGDRVEAGKSAAVVESVKSVSDVFAPVCGEIVEANKSVADSPELINKDPYGKGWMFKLKMEDPIELSALMDSKAYASMVGEKK